MGGRGGSGGMTGGGGSPDFQNAYNDEISNARDFPAAFAIEPDATKDMIGYQMYVHNDVTGRSLIADTQDDINFLKEEYDNADDMGRSYGMSKDSINGMKRGIQYKIDLQTKALNAMKASKELYEKYKRAPGEIRKRLRREGRWGI